MLFWVKLVSQLADAGLGTAAAFYWFKSAQIRTPESFAIHVVRPAMGILDQPLGGTYMGNGYSSELNELAAKLKEQSHLSKMAATYAAGAAVLQAALIFFP
jgi:hypothetical protein